MRGIAGIVNFDGRPADPAEISATIHRMAVGPTHRITHWTEGNASFGHLFHESTIEDRFEAQPLISGDGRAVLVTDFVVENRPELADAWGWTAAECAERPDSAFVLAAWERHGDDWAERLEGQSAAALWRPREQELTLFGGKIGTALFYWQGRGRFAFATTLRGLFSVAGVPCELDSVRFAEHLVRIPHPATRTIYRDVYKLEAGLMLHATRSGVRVRTYWEPAMPTELRLSSDAEYIEAFRDELTLAIRRKLRARRNVGCMLSGGLDSAAVAAVAGRLLAEDGRRLQACHVLPAGESRYAQRLRELDESKYVRAMQAHCPHIDFHFVPADTTTLPLEEWDWYLGVHCVPLHSLPARLNGHLREHLARLGIDRMLTGLSGNAFVSLESQPYRYLGYLAAERRWFRLAREIWGQHRVYGRSGRSMWREVRAGVPRAAGGTESFLGLLAPEFRRTSGIDERVASHQAAADAIPGLRGRLHHVLAGQFRGSRGTPSAGIVPDQASRWDQPLCDRRLSEFCITLPFSQQIRDGWDRRLLRRSMDGWLPPEVVQRVTRGFPQPAFQFKFRDLMQAMGGEANVLAGLTRSAEFVDVGQIKAAFAGARAAEKAQLLEFRLVRVLLLERFLIHQAEGF